MLLLRIHAIETNNMKEQWMKEIYRSSACMEPDLRSKRGSRAAQPDKPLKHSVSRHCALDDEVLNEDGSPFRVGTTFPKWIKPGDITRIQKIVLGEYQRYKHGKSSQVTSITVTGGAERVVVQLRKYGVRRVGAFIRNGSICTVFPEFDD